MYGVSPFLEKSAVQLGDQPVMTLKSHLIAVREVKAGRVSVMAVLGSASEIPKLV